MMISTNCSRFLYFWYDFFSLSCSFPLLTDADESQNTPQTNWNLSNELFLNLSFFTFSDTLYLSLLVPSSVSYNSSYQYKL